MVTGALVTALITAIAIAIRRILFAIGKGLCWIVGFLNDVFDMVAGLENVTYKGSVTQSMPLIKVFFSNTNINTIYWGMALIGIVMCFGFAIFAVIRKSGDVGDKMKQSLGDIIRNCFKGVVLILLMNFIMSATLNITNTLLDRINYLIVNAQSFDNSYDVTFSSKDYAAMGRCLNTIGNYSMNASYNSRYNLNSCYNSIRTDLKQLGDDGKFDDTYITTVHEDGTTRTVNTWQSVLQNIYRSVDDINVPQPLDEYNTKLEEAILEAMDVIRNDASFEALEKYHVDKSSKTVGDTVHLDRMIMLIGSLYGTGEELTSGSGMTDYIRGPFYYGQKDIFDYDEVADDFDMSVGTWMYLTVIIVAFLFAKEMLAMVFNAAARIFNMLLLYITAPPFIAVTPLDDGGKLKQWTTAFIIQSCGLFGTVISLRLVMLFIPILFNGNIEFFSSPRLDTFTRIIIMYAAIYTSRKASGMIVGILADNAGWQAISAGDVGGEARGAIEKGVGLGKSVGGFAMGLAGKGLATADKAVEKKIEEKKKNNSGDDKTAKQNNDGTPRNMLDIGSKNSLPQQAQQDRPPEKANVAPEGPNSSGAIGNGTFETGGNGSAKDFQPKSKLSLEPAGAAPGGSSEAPEGRRPKLSINDSSSNNNPNSSSNAQNQGGGKIPPAPPLPNGAYGTIPEAPQLPNGAYGTIPKAPPLPNEANGTIPKAPQLPQGAYGTVPKEPPLPGRANGNGPQPDNAPQQKPVQAQPGNVNNAPQQNSAPVQSNNAGSVPFNNANMASQQNPAPAQGSASVPQQNPDQAQPGNVNNAPQQNSAPVQSNNAGSVPSNNAAMASQQKPAPAQGSSASAPHQEPVQISNAPQPSQAQPQRNNQNSIPQQNPAPVQSNNAGSVPFNNANMASQQKPAPAQGSSASVPQQSPGQAQPGNVNEAPQQNSAPVQSSNAVSVPSSNANMAPQQKPAPAQGSASVPQQNPAQVQPGNVNNAPQQNSAPVQSNNAGSVPSNNANMAPQQNQVPPQSSNQNSALRQNPVQPQSSNANRAPSNNANAANIAPTGQNGRVSYETGDSGAARDFNYRNAPELEPVEPMQSGSNEAPQPSVRAPFDSFSNQPDYNQSESSSRNRTIPNIFR